MAVKNRSYANRGVTFERIIDMVNTKYRNTGVADIRKVPTPVQITKSKGRAIAFDAKETSGTSFPLQNLSHHQYRLLESWHKKGAISLSVGEYEEVWRNISLTFRSA
ncbi:MULTISPECIES: Holliday junction resolvase RecU [unclassified Lysinibacillus]|uniref:Holliday junction resolvase RecU n=1 Tax=unclassified Lysinibacillus TaxID=2636778 RepID=UPI0020112F5D|nr:MULTISPECIES: Holliday junction resolvase RecU [unclassified Lysinibacillus]MCL1694760.1 Holliday junction resolvase RecU [Lysinibacillus sp. BPa_S21]MCL1699613.1 Holliday junction resolvase RecU [Lysinibacillus sp. Bpr_S20]